MAAVSKNQRAGRKQVHVKPHCPAGHELVHVLVAGRGVRLMCECSGYAPINTSAPYASKAPRLKTGGNARVWYEVRA